MPLKRRKRAATVDLPKGVHHVKTGGREYFYWSPGRGTPYAAQPVRLPDDPTDPKFWIALREAQGLGGAVMVKTFGDVLDLYLDSPQFKGKGDGTRSLYLRQIKIARAGFGSTPAEQMRASMIRGVVDGLADRPGAGNNFLSSMRAVSTWGVVRDHLVASITEGIEPYASQGGHKPWTDAQIQAAQKQLTGAVRRGVFLMIFTGQRGSDVVRIGPTDVDENGFRLAQQKTKREVWCPIVPELAKEMEGWERVPGPFVRQASGRPFTRKLFSKHFDEQRKDIAALKGVTLHGLRATAVIRLRRAGLSTAQIQDVIGMSLAMIERYARFADRKASGQAAILRLSDAAEKFGR